ncbi:MAG: glucosaminidase domain-containing protein [Bacteroidales bacterium]|nr:glucosaminidase domain-containing protein [Bacteroidales bacterium]
MKCLPIVLWSVLLLGVSGAATKAGTPQERYIETYSGIAVREMLRSGVPASITLAQGILESGSGLSTLAVNGNNHFGIKCHKGWTGRTMHLDDDRPGECFRVYDSAEESFRDHSDFLRYRDRYKFLFDLKVTDYKGWAYGLKKAGYATDPKYAAKLIKYIEDYDLSRFDVMSADVAATLPASPLKIEEPLAARTVKDGNMAVPREKFRFESSRVLYSQNKVPFVYAMEGETYSSIARKYHLFKGEILRYNDLKQEEAILPGTIVYLEAKKTKAPKGLDMYIVSQDGEDFHSICQRFAVQEKATLRRNHFTYPVDLREGDQIKLR